ncbi:Panacea domain-containing protein [Candidatus Liberibacter americanus]|uniref:Phage-associated protein n=1 Tax=Candidatus Liberibacter americanus str. Sao Paulo TaxID=1261131 RepID=U6B522_9HYPH|nr:type II toxin-antitoxin system antitoxin SocA domain-containing protein [Candidatus Liberibacter americanus]AHA28169.1 phage-associated protein [Candidatus Liberibacter americanus str. Sao Paulo]EMS35842.1 hypothetical protein G653_04541 [Candidatus Liberibacter americanus PW_SP]
MNILSNERSHDSRAVANYILEKSRIKNKGVDCLTVMHLLKLVYFAHGWSLADSDTPIVEQSPKAWLYGPVYIEIYNPLSKFGTKPIKTLIVDKESNIPYGCELSDNQKRVIDFVLTKYGNIDPLKLSQITHEKNSPWDMVIKALGKYSEIDNDVIQRYYKKQKINRDYAMDIECNSRDE